ncbi:uncharacterized protein LOC125232964 [Leguminivora glycinivorella]|uniref:uncharacterized protein LOC125232964 n=1 Tax=Leguminivora glycinivorella TaxID=1035111 RepID=UPI00200D94EF|nr:uncharacterized protein LOC125232964 [Leguminivora glycinivorella]XP_047994773.1 uncharacterized protein LOC125232964 [Leguminivora glycinivorella]
MDDDKIKRKNRKYNEATLKSAIENVLNSTMTLYKASQEFGIPWTTLKRNVERVKEDQVRGKTQVSMPKIGRPFSLTQNKEIELVQYIKKMQELGFGLTVNRIREIAFELAQSEGSALFFNNEKRVAGWNWWVSFKNRHGLSLRPLRQPENLSAGRAVCSNEIVLNDFYEKLEKTFKDHDLMDSPERIWNCDETGLMYVHKPEKIVTHIGKKYIYNRSYAEKGTTTTVLACMNAAGCFISPMVIFKGKGNYAELQDGAFSNSMTRMSPKGWVNADLFLEWLKFFNENIPPARPVFLIMNSHASHNTPQVLEYAKSHQIVLFTMPAHTRHVLQPLDVGVFRPLKAAWQTELDKYKRENPNLIPTRHDFHKLLTPAYEKAFTKANIRAGFRKTGIYPFNNTVTYTSRSNCTITGH